MSEVDALESVIALHEHGHLKILMRDGKAGPVPCILDGRRLEEVRRAEQVVARRF